MRKRRVLQLNALVTRNDQITLLKSLHNNINLVPLMIIVEESEINRTDADSVRAQALLPRNFFEVFILLTLALSLAILVVSVLIFQDERNSEF